MKRPERNEYAEYYEGYVSAIEETDIVSVLCDQPHELRTAFAGIPEEKGTFSYAEGKWTIKELLGHIIDAERVFGYRLHRFSHGDTTPLASFDQDIYVANGRSNDRTFVDLISEFEASRNANIHLVRSLRESDWDLKGVASNAEVTVRALAFIMAGHVRHHARILQERYFA
ncbi:MAG: DinB family protein [Pyrinomonadaceae bacterium]|nr:DinB family protein [Pyrinomonadaceae bacterium]